MGERLHRREHVERTVQKTGNLLGLFDCATCDLCISACPNDANMRLRSLDIAAAVMREGAPAAV